MRGLSGRRVLLTGGASGIGRATAVRLAAAGCAVGILDINEEGAAETARLCDGEAWMRHIDITSRTEVEAAVAAFEQDVGPSDFLANIAGWDMIRNFLDTDVGLWDRPAGGLSRNDRLSAVGRRGLHYRPDTQCVRRPDDVLNVASA
jgi:2-hydroxycyclohexanecarboxyl-CoA dehydrogenase